MTESAPGRWPCQFARLVVGLALLLPLAGGDALRVAWRYERAGIAAGQAWRLLTAHLVHLDAWHALLNLLGAWLLGALFTGLRGMLHWLFITAVSVAVIDAGFWWGEPQLAWYVGASGVLHGIMAAGTLELLHRREFVAWPAALLFLAKLLWEWHVGPLPFEGGGPVVVVAHLYGALGGVAGSLLATLYRAAILALLSKRDRA